MPGLTSTKKLPSRNVRGRIANVAFLWSGSPCLSNAIVTSAALHRAGVCDASWQPGAAWMLCTFPTSTPAIRTSDAGRSPFALENVA